MSDRYWSLYILLKHLCEVIVLTLELIISTAIKSYDSRAQPVMHTPGSARGAGVAAVAGMGTQGNQGTNNPPQSVVTSQPPRGRLSGQYAPITSNQPPGNAPAASYGATNTTSGAGAVGGRNSRHSSGTGGGSGGASSSNSGRYKGNDYGVELATERTPMLHQQYESVGNNEV